MRDAKRLTRLLTEKIETIEPGFCIEVLNLTARLTESVAENQTLSTMVDDAPPDVSDLADTLINRVGERSLYRAAPVASLKRSLVPSGEGHSSIVATSQSSARG